MTSFFRNKFDNNAFNQAQLSPKSTGQVATQFFSNSFNHYLTVGTAANEENIFSEYYEQFNDLFPDANIVDPFYTSPQINYASPTGTPVMSFKRKMKMAHDQIGQYLSSIPKDDPRRQEYKDYKFYTDRLLKKQQESDKKTAMYQEAGRNFAAKYIGPLAGMSGAAFIDPMFIATLPLSVFSGGSTAVGFLAREAAIGASMGFFGQTLVESQVYPYKKRIGDEQYTLKTAAQNVGMVTVAGALFAPVLAGGIRYGAGPVVKDVLKGFPNITSGAKYTHRQIFQAVDKQLVKLKPDLKNKIIGREFNKLVDQGANEEQLLKYIGQRILSLKPIDQLRFIETLGPESVSKNIDIQFLKQELESLNNLEIENIHPLNKEGRKIDKANQEAAQEALITGEEMNLTELPFEPIIKPERIEIRQNNIDAIKKSLDESEIDTSKPIQTTDSAIGLILLKQSELENFADPTNVKMINRVADQDLDALKIDSDLASSIEGDLITSPGVKSSSIQEDVTGLQPTTAEPPSTVLASATASPLRSRIEPEISIGSFNDISNKPLLHATDNVDELYTLARKNIKNIQGTLNNIVDIVPNTTTKLRIKKRSMLEKNVKNGKKLYGDVHTAAYEPDILGGRIIVNTMDDLNKVRDYLASNYQIITEKNFYQRPREKSHYRAHHYQLITNDGLGVEIQLHHKDMLKAIENGKAYRKFKNIKNRALTLEEEELRLQLEAEDAKMFDDAYNRIIEKETTPDTKRYTVGEEIVDGEIVNKTMTLKELIDDIDNDKAIIERLKDCA